MNHTPGEWKIEGYAIYTESDDGKIEVVAHVVSKNDDALRLIASAPELLKALIEIEASYLNNRSVHYMAHVAAAAIAKANNG